MFNRNTDFIVKYEKYLSMKACPRLCFVLWCYKWPNEYIESCFDPLLYKDFVRAVYDGVGSGLEVLTDTLQEKARMMQNELVKQYPQNEVR